jgi:WD40-like Beta Propeller Repeat
MRYDGGLDRERGQRSRLRRDVAELDVAQDTPQGAFMVENSFKEEVLFEFGDDMPPLDYTRDGEHVLWVRFYEEQAASIVWDGVVGPRFDDLVFFDDAPVIFSPDKHHVAWIGKRGEVFVVVVDDSIRGEWSYVDTEVVPTLSNSGRIALIAWVDRRRRVILDGSPFTDWEAAGALAFSSDGNHFAFVALDGPNWRVVVDGVPGPAFDQLGGGTVGTGPQTVVFTPDGNRCAYPAKRGDRWHVVVDGEVGPAHEGLYGLPVFSADGTRLAYQAVDEDRACVVVDGSPEHLHRNIGRPVFSPDGTRLMYMISDDRAAMVVDGEQGPDCDDLYFQADTAETGYGFSPDSRHFGYLACEGKRFLHAGKWFAVVDGEKGPEFDGVSPQLGAGTAARAEAGAPRFSLDGTHFAFPARVGKKWSMVVDGVPGEEFHLSGYPRFSATGRLAYVAKLDKRRAVYVLDGKPGPVMTDAYLFDDQPFVFSPDGAHLVYEGEIEDAWHPVVDDLVGPQIPVGLPIFNDDGSIAFIGLREPDSKQHTRQICRVTYAAHSSPPSV